MSKPKPGDVVKGGNRMFYGQLDENGRVTVDIGNDFPYGNNTVPVDVETGQSLEGYEELIRECIENEYLSEGFELCEVDPYEVVDGLVSVYTSDLLLWAWELPNKYRTYIDEQIQHGQHRSLCNLLMAAQYDVLTTLTRKTIEMMEEDE